MDEEFGQKLADAFDEHSRSSYEYTVNPMGEIIELRGNPGSIGPYVFLFLTIIVVPGVLLSIDISFYVIIFSFVWIGLLGKIFIEVIKYDVISRFNLREKTVEIASMNPFVEKVLHGIMIRFYWEGVFHLSRFKEVVIREKKYGKLLSDRGFRLVFIADDRRAYPVAEFSNAMLAEKVAYIFTRITGAKYMKIRAY